jgi:hypothetical protein
MHRSRHVVLPTDDAEKGDGQTDNRRAAGDEPVNHLTLMSDAEALDIWNVSISHADTVLA